MSMTWLIMGQMCWPHGARVFWRAPAYHMEALLSDKDLFLSEEPEDKSMHQYEHKQQLSHEIYFSGSGEW